MSKAKSITAKRMTQTNMRSNTNAMMGHLAHSNLKKPLDQQIFDLQNALRKTCRQIDKLRAKLDYVSFAERKELELKIWKKESVRKSQIFKLSMLAKRKGIKPSFPDALAG